MNPWYTFLFSILTLSVHGQVIQSNGANTQLNWRPNTAADSLTVDVDGDAAPDIVFTNINTPAGGFGLPYFTRFVANIKRGNSAEIALDANEFDSVHRFAAGDVIGPGLLWQRGGGFLAYTVTGNGGIGGRGFFRYNNDGFVTIRKRAGNQMRYWWFYIGTRAIAGTDWVSYYAGTSVALATRSSIGSEPAIVAFPNPTTAHLSFSGAASYELFNCNGLRLSTSSGKLVSNISLEALPAGLYLLVMHIADGNTYRQMIVKQ